MQQEIEQFKKQNGSLVNYTVKELLYSVNHKLDKITERLENGEIRFTKMDTTLKWHFKAISLLYAIMGAFLIKPVRYVIRLLGG